MTTLILSSRHTPDNQAIWRAATARGWAIERTKDWETPVVRNRPILLYVESLHVGSFHTRKLADSLALELIEPPGDWLVSLPHEYRQRSVELESLADARRRTRPIFVKSVNDWLFDAKVFMHGEDLPPGYDDELVVLAIEPVSLEVEYRCFVLDRKVMTMSPYLRDGVFASDDDFTSAASEWREAIAFAEYILGDDGVDCPQAFVLDVGREAKCGWIVIDANPAWSSSIYGCDPDAVLSVLEHSVQPKEIA